MTVQNPAVFLQSEAHPAEDVRRMLTAIAGTTGGVVDTGALAVSETSGAPSMGVDVAGGRAWIAGSEATYQGVYFVENRGVEALTIGASDPTNGRHDLIVAKVEDSEYSGSVNAWSLVVVAGTADPSPVDPATPANSITLARVTVGAGVSTITDANITDLRNVVGLEARVADLETPPVDTKTASYTLVAADKNSRVVMNSASATTITVDDGVFSAGDSVWIHNIGAGTCTVTAGTATVDTSATLDVGQWEGGSLYFTSASSAIFFRGGGGVSAANFTDTATGTYTDGGTNYKYLTFNSSGTITIDTAGLCDILVVGGGGSGGVNGGGGGGAGGHLYATGAYLPVGTHTVTVGGGGAAVFSPATDSGFSGLAGSPSQIHNYIVPGGGGGGGLTYNSGGSLFRDTAQTGGSGGGGQSTDGGNTSIVGTGLSGIGNNGGLGNASAAGGGGGGAGAAGSNAGSAVGGAGGDGLANSITGSSVTRAGGGGGGGSIVGAGGAGGGGNGSGTYGGTAGSGTANTGGGGGGMRRSTGGSTSGAGGSGVVIIRVEV